MVDTNLKALWDRAIALHGEGRYADALDCMRTVEASLPDNAALLSGLGVVHRDNGDLVHAEQYLRRACAAQPNDSSAHFNLALTLLRAGSLREGFEEYEWRWQVEQFREQRRKFSQPTWNGEPLHGRRILIHSEQGAGDAIQFLRYARLVRAAGGDAIVEVLPHMERLASWLDGGYPIVNALTPGLQFDLQCPLMSLPRRFGTELDSIPPPARFLIPVELTDKWIGRTQKGKMNVGIVWAGNPTNHMDAARSISARLIQPLTHVPGIEWWSLQVGPSAVETPDGIVNLAGELIDFGETAAVISALDLVITVDTAAAHLAGSLGKPVWLLVAYTSDWRWLLDREDTPWYPSMKIFRQKRPGDWPDVIERVASKLAVTQ